MRGKNLSIEINLFVEDKKKMRVTQKIFHYPIQTPWQNNEIDCLIIVTEGNGSIIVLALLSQYRILIKEKIGSINCIINYVTIPLMYKIFLTSVVFMGCKPLNFSFQKMK